MVSLAETGRRKVGGPAQRDPRADARQRKCHQMGSRRNRKLVPGEVGRRSRSNCACQILGTSKSMAALRWGL